MSEIKMSNESTFKEYFKSEVLLEEKIGRS